jgi:DNA-binding beta-propeller fold protein YncE
MGKSVSQPLADTAAAALLAAKTSLMALACLTFPAQFTAASEPLVQLRSIPLEGVEGRLDHLTFDSRSQRLFVAALENHSIEVLDLPRRRRIHQITGISEPQGPLCIPEKNRLLVCSRGDGTCRSFDATTFQEGPWVDLGRNADNIRFDPDAQTIYVGSGGEPGNGLLSAIDLPSLLPAAQGGQPAPPHSPADFLLGRPRQADPRMETQLPAHPESFQIDRANRRLFVNLPDEHQIAVLQIGTNTLTKAASWPVTVGEENFPMTLDPASSRLYIAGRKPALLAMYDTTTGALLTQTPCAGDADDMFYDAKLKRVYVIGGEGCVDVFQVSDTSHEPACVARLPTAPRARTGLFIPELQMLAVAAPHTTNRPAAILLFQSKP